MLQRQIIIFNIASKVRQFQLSNICLYHEAKPYYIILWTHTDDTMKPLKYIYKLSMAGLEKLKFDNITANYDKKTHKFWFMVNMCKSSYECTQENTNDSRSLDSTLTLHLC